jgi:hypothetical protein
VYPDPLIYHLNPLLYSLLGTFLIVCVLSLEALAKRWSIPNSRVGPVTGLYALQVACSLPFILLAALLVRWNKNSGSVPDVMLVAVFGPLVALFGVSGMLQSFPTRQPPSPMQLRLAISAFALVLLVAWMVIFTWDSMPDGPGTRDGVTGYPYVFLVTAALSLSIIVACFGVILNGSWCQRLLAVLLILFPTGTFVILVYCVLFWTRAFRTW